jgi:hypothetical protein
VASLALTAASAAPAQAALISTNTCDSSSLSQPFAAWGDNASYKLVPGGDVESSASGWKLSGAATTVAGSEPFGITGSVGATSLSIPAGASVQSPFTCVNAGYPALRFMARNDGVLSTLAVTLTYKDPILGLVPIPVGTVTLSNTWQPTLRMPTLALVGGLLSGGTAQVSVHFTALIGSSQIDDVFVDPRNSR